MNLPTPAWRDASSRLSVPITFCVASKTGSRTESETLALAAWWLTTSGCSACTKASRAGSVTSISTRRAAGGTCSRLPVLRLSTTTTWWPACK